MTTYIPPELQQDHWDRLDAAVDLSLGATSVTLLTESDLLGYPARQQIYIYLEGLSGSGTDDFLLQVGDSGGFHTSSYAGAAASASNSAHDDVTSTAGFILGDTFAAAGLYDYDITLTHLGGNKWRMTGQAIKSDGTVFHLFGGVVVLDTQLTQVRITTVGGTDTLDAGDAYVQHR